MASGAPFKTCFGPVTIVVGIGIGGVCIRICGVGDVCIGIGGVGIGIGIGDVCIGIGGVGIGGGGIEGSIDT